MLTIYFYFIFKLKFYQKKDFSSKDFPTCLSQFQEISPSWLSIVDWRIWSMGVHEVPFSCSGALKWGREWGGLTFFTIGGAL